MIGLTFTLFIFVYTCASSSVYAKTLRDMPTENGTIAEPDEEELAGSRTSPLMPLLPRILCLNPLLHWYRV